MLREKINSKKGTAVLVWILVVVLVAVLGVILTPVIEKAVEAARVEEDESHEQTVWDSAFMRWVAEGGEFEAVYDFANKEWIDNLNGVKITPYGVSKPNKDKVIFVHCDEEGNITMKWEDPLKYLAE